MEDKWLRDTILYEIQIDLVIRIKTGPRGLPHSAADIMVRGFLASNVIPVCVSQTHSTIYLQKQCSTTYHIVPSPGLSTCTEAGLDLDSTTA